MPRVVGAFRMGRRAAGRPDPARFPQKDVEPCLQIGRMAAEVQCKLESARRHLARGDSGSANADLVLAERAARDLASAFPPARRDAERIAGEADAVSSRIRGKDGARAADREALVSRLAKLAPSVRGLFVRAHAACPARGGGP